jgi:hypothetical protein
VATQSNSGVFDAQKVWKRDCEECIYKVPKANAETRLCQSGKGLSRVLSIIVVAPIGQSSEGVRMRSDDEGVKCKTRCQKESNKPNPINKTKD